MNQVYQNLEKRQISPFDLSIPKPEEIAGEIPTGPAEAEDVRHGLESIQRVLSRVCREIIQASKGEL